jgi:GNAT superfamily N-acetyltransferase
MGLVVRTAMPGDMMAVAEAHSEAVTDEHADVAQVHRCGQRGIVESSLHHFRTQYERYAGNCFLVAELEGVVVGWITASGQSDVAGYRGEIGTLGVARTARRSGAGAALVCAAASWLRERSLTPTLECLWSGGSVAEKFYRSLGAVGPICHKEVKCVPVDTPFPQEAYGWPDDGEFAAACARGTDRP